MSVTKQDIEDTLDRLALPDGGTLISRDMIRALTVENGSVRFVIEAPSPAIAQQMEPLRVAAAKIVGELEGVTSVSALLTAHGPAPKAPEKLMSTYIPAI